MVDRNRHVGLRGCSRIDEHDPKSRRIARRIRRRIRMNTGIRTRRTHGHVAKLAARAVVVSEHRERVVGVIVNAVTARARRQ